MFRVQNRLGPWLPLSCCSFSLRARAAVRSAQTGDGHAEASESKGPTHAAEDPKQSRLVSAFPGGEGRSQKSWVVEHKDAAVISRRRIWILGLAHSVSVQNNKPASASASA